MTSNAGSDTFRSDFGTGVGYLFARVGDLEPGLLQIVAESNCLKSRIILLCLFDALPIRTRKLIDDQMVAAKLKLLAAQPTFRRNRQLNFLRNHPTLAELAV